MSTYRTMDDGPLSEVSVHRVGLTRKRADAKPARPPGAQADGAKLRKAAPVNEPLPATFKWIARLPREVQPLNVLRQYPRVANNLALTWKDRRAFRKCLYDLLADTRGERQGFPSAVLGDLLTLRAYFEQVDSIPGDDPGFAGR